MAFTFIGHILTPCLMSHHCGEIDRVEKTGSETRGPGDKLTVVTRPGIGSKGVWRETVTPEARQGQMGVWARQR